VAGRMRSIEKSSDLIRNLTCDLLACNIIPQPTVLTCDPITILLAGQLINSLVISENQDMAHPLNLKIW
jgi:hypothetical protein